MEYSVEGRNTVLPLGHFSSRPTTLYRRDRISFFGQTQLDFLGRTTDSEQLFYGGFWPAGARFAPPLTHNPFSTSLPSQTSVGSSRGFLSTSVTLVQRTRAAHYPLPALQEDTYFRRRSRDHTLCRSHTDKAHSIDRPQEGVARGTTHHTYEHRSRLFPTNTCATSPSGNVAERRRRWCARCTAVFSNSSACLLATCSKNLC